MKAYQIEEQTGIDAAKPVELPDPEPGPGQVLVRVRAASLNYRDLMVAQGGYPGVNLPLIPLSDGAGEVVAVGDGVQRWKKTDRVAGIFSQNWLTGPYTPEAFTQSLGGGLSGMLAEYVVLPEAGLVALPGHLSFEEGATLTCAAVTAWHALVEKARMAAGDTVLVLGTGGVSLFGLQFAKLSGCRVIATSSSDEKLEKLRKLGADATINYKSTPDWDEEVNRLTDGAGVNHIIEVGGKDTFPKSLNALAPNGTVVVIGGVGGGFTAEAPLRAMIGKNANVHGILVGSRDMFEAMNRAISQAELRPVVDKVFPFAEAGDAYAHLASGAHFGKVVVSI